MQIIAIFCIISDTNLICQPLWTLKAFFMKSSEKIFSIALMPFASASNRWIIADVSVFFNLLDETQPPPPGIHVLYFLTGNPNLDMKINITYWLQSKYGFSTKVSSFFWRFITHLCTVGVHSMQKSQKFYLATYKF